MRTVLITGANRGIGLETAMSFARAGWRVYATMRDAAKSKELLARMAGEELQVEVRELDVNSDASVQTCFEQVFDEVGALDVLINNAGIERHGSVEGMEIEDFKEVMDTNYLGIVRCVKAVLPLMRERKQGCILNVSSVAGHIASSPMSGYAASKFAVEAFSEALAQEVKPFNIRISLVEPGIINTDMAKDIQHAKRNANYPQAHRFGGLFTASLENPNSPALVAERMLAIVQSGTWELRHPVGPDAIPFLDWRASMTDEQWINWNAADDDTWYANVSESFGLDARKRATAQKRKRRLKSSPVSKKKKSVKQ